MSKKNQHVVPGKNGGWNVKGEGNSKATTHTETKQEAIDKAREIAKNQRSELVIHGKDGKIQDKDSYGNDPVPPRDTKH
ncbi:MAG TPA: DUF2188 domain-containing protein [Chitinophagaceae bacterium]|jgi:hypothetical protein|nr:DUF2188 domain-containing protein [Chitinophagaceae bacterium]